MTGRFLAAIGALYLQAFAMHQAQNGVISLRVSDPSPEAVVALLRAQHCAPVSFISTHSLRTVTLDLQGVSVEEALRQIAVQDPTYRSDVIDERNVLYPAGPEFQHVVRNVEIADVPRLDASYRYLDRLGREVPAFSNLVAPVVFGDSRHPIFSTRVSVRRVGRVIEQLVDLLGEDRSLYLEFGKAMSGASELAFRKLACDAIAPSPPQSHPGGARR